MNKVIARTRILNAGDIVTVHPCGRAYPLPAGLNEGTIVTVLRRDYGYCDVVDQNGKVWRVALSNVHLPMSLWWQGRWIDRATHPDGEAAWAAYAAQNAVGQAK